MYILMQAVRYFITTFIIKLKSQGDEFSMLCVRNKFTGYTLSLSNQLNENRKIYDKPNRSFRSGRTSHSSNFMRTESILSPISFIAVVLDSKSATLVKRKSI